MVDEVAGIYGVDCRRSEDEKNKGLQVVGDAIAALATAQTHNNSSEWASESEGRPAKAKYLVIGSFIC